MSAAVAEIPRLSPRLSDDDAEILKLTEQVANLSSMASEGAAALLLIRELIRTPNPTPVQQTRRLRSAKLFYIKPRQD